MISLKRRFSIRTCQLLLVCTSLPVSLCSTAYAQSDESATFASVSEFVESLQPTRPVAGDVVVGLAGTGAGSVTPPLIEAWIPSEWRDQAICLMVRSRDGRYEAYQAFQVPLEWTAAFHTFLFEEIRENEFLSKEVEQLAASASLGPCGGDSSESALTYWGGRSRPNEGILSVYLNSRRANEASIYFFQNDTEVTCQPVDGADRQVFDFICQVEEASGVNRVEVTRVRRGNYDKPSEYMLYFPD